MSLPSIVRAYYASRGVTSEMEYLRAPPADRYEFQLGLLDYYMASLLDALGRLDDAHGLILDRSAFDHIAYAVYAHPGATMDQITRIMEFGLRFAALRPIVAFFPYPTSWTGRGITEDGFRATEVGKDYAIDALMRRVLQGQYPSYRVVTEAPPEERAKFLWVMWAAAQGGVS